MRTTEKRLFLTQGESPADVVTPMTWGPLRDLTTPGSKTGGPHLITAEQADDYVNITGVMVSIDCSGCGTAMLKYPAHVRRNRQRGIFRMYCSRACQSKHREWEPVRGENHPQWKGGEYTYRQRALHHYGAFCHSCGYDKELSLLWVHHKDFGRKDSRLENLEVLCIRCHLELHIERDRALSE